MAITRKKIEIEIAFQDNINFIARAIPVYLKGDTSEAVRIANSLSILLVSRGKNISLLSQLDTSNEKKFYTSIEYSATQENLFGNFPLAHIEMVNGGNNVPSSVNAWPNCRSTPDISNFPTLNIEDWLNEPVLSVDSTKIYNRLDCIKILRDKEGGAHYDKNLDERSAAFLSLGSGQVWAIEVSSGEETYHMPLKFLHASVVQMAHEILFSMGFIDVSREI